MNTTIITNQPAPVAVAPATPGEALSVAKVQIPQEVRTPEMMAILQSFADKTGIEIVGKDDGWVDIKDSTPDNNYAIEQATKKARKLDEPPTEEVFGKMVSEELERVSWRRKVMKTEEGHAALALSIFDDYEDASCVTASSMEEANRLTSLLIECSDAIQAHLAARGRPSERRKAEFLSRIAPQLARLRRSLAERQARGW